MINKFMQTSNKNLIFSVFMGACLGLSGNAFAQSEDMKASYNKTLKLALQANQKVLLLEHQWTTVPELLEQAKDAAKQKDFGSANKFAAEALKHAELGIEQAQKEAQRWVNSVPR